MNEPDRMADVRVPGRVPDRLFHYSENGGVARFLPQVPPSNPSHPPAVFALDADHAPLYWFPRNCPRISVWANDERQQAVLSDRFGTEAKRIVAAELHWIDGIRRARIYRYTFDGAPFARWAQADGQYVSADAVTPLSVEPIDDLLALHAAAEVELRFTVRLGRLMDQMLASGLPFSYVRIRDARR